MSDYIERQKVKDIRFSGGINHDGFLYVPYKELVDGIKALPSADVVQVVRCKDCRKCSYDPLFNYYWCNLTLGTRRVKPDDFCSYGEREE